MVEEDGIIASRSLEKEPESEGPVLGGSGESEDDAFPLTIPSDEAESGSKAVVPASRAVSHRISNGSDNFPTPRASAGYPTPRASIYQPTPRASKQFGRISQNLDALDLDWQKLFTSLPVVPPAKQQPQDLDPIGEVPELRSVSVNSGWGGEKRKYRRRGSESSAGSSTHSSFQEYFSSSSSGSDDDEEDQLPSDAEETGRVCGPISLTVHSAELLLYSHPPCPAECRI